MHHIDTEKLNSKIDKMSKEQHMDIFILLRKNGKLTINENKNGFFANLFFFPEDVLQELLFYVDRKMDATIN
jgi:retron-type reverse transcriptase